MKFSELNKEQKQYLILGVMALAFAVFGLNNFLVAPMRARSAAAEKTISELESEVRIGEALLRRDKSNQEELQRLAREILEIHETQLPPEISRYNWGFQLVSSVTAPMGLQPRVQQHGTPRFMPHTGNYTAVKNTSTFWIPYAITLDLDASYQEVIELIEGFYTANPHTSVASLTLQRIRETPEKHQVNMILEWPVLRHAEDLEYLTTLRGTP